MLNPYGGICDYNESYFARRAMLIGLRLAIFLSKSTTEFSETIRMGFVKLKDSNCCISNHLIIKNNK